MGAIRFMNAAGIDSPTSQASHFSAGMLHRLVAAPTGGALAELLARLGHSTAVAARCSQQAAAGRDAEIAAKLSEIAARQ